MRPMFAFLMTTLDGYYEGPNQEFDWPNVDDEFNEFAVQQLDEADTLVFGRATYEGMASYWPTEAARHYDAIVAERMNSTAKIVCSTTLDRAEWQNTWLIRNDVAGELDSLQTATGQGPGHSRELQPHRQPHGLRPR